MLFTLFMYDRRDQPRPQVSCVPLKKVLGTRLDLISYPDLPWPAYDRMRSGYEMRLDQTLTFKCTVGLPFLHLPPGPPPTRLMHLVEPR